MEFEHKSVLFNESIDNLNIKRDGVYLDGTLGGAGHSLEIYRRLNHKGTLIGLDQDDVALYTSKSRLEKSGSEARLILVNTNFKNLKNVCEENQVEGLDGILLDLGVSSYQLDDAERGFSYNKDAPLDMRMDRRSPLTAEIIVNEYEKDDIKNIIRDYGEEKWASRISEFIARARMDKRIKTTEELVDIIKAAIPSSARRDGPHPAKRTFQALRIAVNDELGILANTIKDGIDLLNQDGRFCIITFHSLEDRIVKNEFAKSANPCTCPSSFPICVCGRKPLTQIVTKKPVAPSDEELLYNHRSRSAKLRVVKKL